MDVEEAHEASQDYSLNSFRLVKENKFEFVAPKSESSIVLRALHDQLLEMKPKDASHDVASCPFCTGELASETQKGGSVTTYTDDEVQALVSELAEYKAKVEELESVRREQGLESRIAEVRAELEARIADLQKELDSAVLEAQKAREEREEIVAWLDGEAERQVAEEQAKARRDERLAKVREVASFPEEYLERNADRWSAMADDEFASLVSDWEQIGTKSSTGETTSTIPVETAMAQTRKDDPSWKSLLREVSALRLNGIDTRNL